MKEKFGMIVGLGACLALIVTIAFITASPVEDPYAVALAWLEHNGDTKAQIYLLADWITSGDLPWEDVRESYNRLAQLISSLTESPRVTETRRWELNSLWLGVAVAVGEQAMHREDWELAHTAFSHVDEILENHLSLARRHQPLFDADYFVTRAQLLTSAPPTPEEVSAEVCLLVDMALELTSEGQHLQSMLAPLAQALAALAEAQESAVALVACGQGSWLAAVLLDDAETGWQLLQREIELSHGSFSEVSFPTGLQGTLLHRTWLWRINRSRAHALALANAGKYEAALSAFRALDQTVAEGNLSGQELAALWDDVYFQARLMTVISLAARGAMSADDLETELSQLLETAVGLSPGNVDSPPLRDRLELIFSQLESDLISLTGEIWATVCEELIFMAFLLGDGESGIEYTHRWIEWATEGGVQAYTLAELAQHPEIARFVIRGTGTYTSMKVCFTYVAEPIEVIVLPLVFRYTGPNGYQDMAVYRVERWVITGPVEKIVPALCLDFNDATPSPDLEGYEIQEFPGYGSVDPIALTQRLYLLQLIEANLARAASLGLEGYWIVLSELSPEVWERIKSLVVWNLTNPSEWSLDEVTQDLQHTMAILRIQGFLASRLPLPSGVQPDLREEIANEVAWLVLIPDWESTW
ncbi:MAG TPA: hypothetical protein EYP49_06425, partial [Anaerolineae bacterium]|nr:hypothetical protein [Anaerolineae bacterium]